MRPLIEFIFPSRLHRLAYFLRATFAAIVGEIIYSCGATFNHEYFWAVVIVICIYSFFFIDLLRIRDVGMSGWWLLVGFAIFPPYWLGIAANLWLGLILIFRAPSFAINIPKSSGSAESQASDGSNLGR